MTRVLMVAYHFPPIGGGGVQRASKFARYLADFDVTSLVLTGPGEIEGRWTPPDPTLLADVADVDVVRVPGQAPPVTAARMRRGFERLSGARSEFTRWWIDSIGRFTPPPGKTFDVILGELVPYETAFGVEKLARRLGLPWVADLQDPWALDEMWLYPSAIHRHVDRTLMRRTLGSASAVVMNTPEARKRLIDVFPEIRADRVVSIANGFDEEDFAGDGPEAQPDVFRIVHTGTLHTELGTRHRTKGQWRRFTGGMPVAGVDFLTRSHVFLLQAVQALLDRDSSLRGVVEVDLAGVATQEDRAAAAGYPFVQFHGYLPHRETISLLKAADLLFLPMHDLPAGVRAGLVPGKTYEYLASGTPILAAVPDGDARDILVESGNATVCRPADVECLTRGIEQRVADWRAEIAPPTPDASVLARFERRKLTADLAEVLVRAVESDRPR